MRVVFPHDLGAGGLLLGCGEVRPHSRRSLALYKVSEPVPYVPA
jgi:hypothetical protein